MIFRCIWTVQDWDMVWQEWGLMFRRPIFHAAKVKYCFWEKTDSEHTAIRLATSRATRKESVDELFAVLDSTEKGLRP